MKLEDFLSAVRNMEFGTLIAVDHEHSLTQYRHIYEGTYEGVTADRRLIIRGEPAETDRTYDSGIRHIHFSEIIQIKVIPSTKWEQQTGHVTTD